MNAAPSVMGFFFDKVLKGALDKHLSEEALNISGEANSNIEIMKQLEEEKKGKSVFDAPKNSSFLIVRVHHYFLWQRERR